MFQDSERPLVVSMGSVAASGGYWISMAAERDLGEPDDVDGLDRCRRDDPDVPAHARRLSACTSTASARRELSGAFETTRPMSDTIKGLIGPNR